MEDPIAVDGRAQGTETEPRPTSRPAWRAARTETAVSIGNAPHSLNEGSLDKHALLDELVAEKHLTLKGLWTIRDVADLFGVQKRAIYDWIESGRLAARDLPGRSRFLSSDLEEFLQKSKRTRRTGSGKRGRR